MAGEPVEELFVALGANTSGFAAGLGGVSTMLSKFSASLPPVGAAIAGVFTAAGVAVAAFSVSAYKDIEEAVNTIRVGTGATGEALDALSDNMRNVASNVPQSFQDVGTAIADLNTRLGLTGQPLEDLATQFLNLSRITGIDVATAIREVTRTFGDWGIAAEDQAEALDYLFQVSQSTGIGVDQLAAKATLVGVPLRQLGLSFEDSAAMIGKWEKEGVNSEMLMASLTRAATNLGKEGVPDMNAAWEEMTGAIKGARTESEAMTIAAEYFGARAAANMSGAIREGRLDVENLTGALSGSSETINSAAADTLTLGEKFDILKNKVGVIIEPIGKGLVQALEWVVDRIMPAVEWVKNLFSSLGEGGGTLGGVTEGFRGAFESIKEIVQRVVEFVQALWNMFGENIIQAARNAWEFIKGIFQSAFDAIKGIFDIFIGIFTGDWSRAWEGIKGIFSGIWNAIASVFQYIWDTIKNILSAAWNAIVGIMRPIWDGIKTFFTTIWDAVVAAFTFVWDLIRGILEGAWNGITMTFHAIWDAFIAVVSAIWDGISAAWNTVWGAVTGVLSAVWGGIQSLWDSTGGKVVSFLATVWDGLTGTWQKIWDGLTGIVKIAWEGIKNAVESAINFVIDIVNGFITACNWIPFVNIDPIPDVHFASGGIVTGPTVGLIGEREAEAVIPLSRLGAVMAEVNAAGAASGGGTTVEINFHGTVISDDRSWEAMARKLQYKYVPKVTRAMGVT